MHWDFDFCLFFWFWSGRPSDDLFTHGLNQLIPRDIHSHYVPRGQPPQYVCYNFFWIPRLVVNNSTQQSNSRQQSRWITTRDGIGRNHHKQNNITCLFFCSIGAKPQWMEFYICWAINKKNYELTLSKAWTERLKASYGGALLRP